MKIYKYKTLEEIDYFSERYNKRVIVPKGYYSDGATGAIDLKGEVKVVKIEDILDGEVTKEEVIFVSKAWLVHDKLCDSGEFIGGAKCSNWQASKVLQDILAEENHQIRKHYWFWSTWLLGGGKARKNGMW